MIGESWDGFTKGALIERHISVIMCENPGGHAPLSPATNAAHGCILRFHLQRNMETLIARFKRAACLTVSIRNYTVAAPQLEHTMVGQKYFNGGQTSAWGAKIY